MGKLLICERHKTCVFKECSHIKPHKEKWGCFEMSCMGEKVECVPTDTKPTNPEKTYTAALREKLKSYFSIYPDGDSSVENQIECAIKAIGRLNRKYGK